MGMAYCIHWSLGMGSQWGRRLNGDAVLCSLIMKGPRHNGDGVLYSPVTGGRDLRGTSSQRGRRTVIKDHEGVLWAWGETKPLPAVPAGPSSLTEPP